MFSRLYYQYMVRLFKWLWYDIADPETRMLYELEHDKPKTLEWNPEWVTVWSKDDN